MVNRIHKKRGRKKFVLSQDDYQIGQGGVTGAAGPPSASLPASHVLSNEQQSSSYRSHLNKREQKYLDKVLAMANQPLSAPDAQRTQPLLNGELQEFKTTWPTNQHRCL